MYFAYYRNLSKIFKGFQGYLEIPWKILESLKHSTLALIYTSLEDVNLDIALKFKVFQGQLKFSLEIFGWSSTLKILDVFRKGYLDLDWTLNFKVNFKEPWNSRLRFSSLIGRSSLFCIHFRMTTGGGYILVPNKITWISISWNDSKNFI